MVLRKEFIDQKILKLKQYILGLDGLIQNIEFFRGLYRYPKMIGRVFNINTFKANIDVLVIAAHPDDDVLGLGTTIYRHQLKGENIIVVFTTNGTNWGQESWRVKASEAERRASVRYQEAVKALSLIGIPQENIFCLGFPDYGTHRYLKYLAKDIKILINKFTPRYIYTHCIEGGHSDHDMTSFITKSICNNINHSNLYEWTEYNPYQPLGTKNVRFLPSNFYSEEGSVIEISAEERDLKKKMLAFHKSQNVEKFFLQGEALRPANFSNMELELELFCKLSKRRLVPVVKKFKRSISNF